MVFSCVRIDNFKFRESKQLVGAYNSNILHFKPILNEWLESSDMFKFTSYSNNSQNFTNLLANPVISCESKVFVVNVLLLISISTCISKLALGVAVFKSWGFVHK